MKGAIRLLHLTGLFSRRSFLSALEDSLNDALEVLPDLVKLKRVSYSAIDGAVNFVRWQETEHIGVDTNKFSIRADLIQNYWKFCFLTGAVANETKDETKT